MKFFNKNFQFFISINFIFLLLLFIFINITACTEEKINTESKLSYIKIVPYSPEVNANDKIQFIANGYDSNGNLLMVSPIWEAHEGRIDSKGVYIAPSYKTIDRVTAFVNSISATTTIKVKKDLEAFKIEIFPKLNYLSCGSEEKFKAYGYNRFGEEVPINVKWECKYGIITDDGTYKAPLHPINDTIIAKTSSTTGVLPIEIKPREVYKIFINPKTIQLKVSMVTRFKAYAYDIYGNKINDDIGFRFNALYGKVTDDGYYYAPNIPITDKVTVVYNFITDYAEVIITE